MLSVRRLPINVLKTPSTYSGALYNVGVRSIGFQTSQKVKAQYFHSSPNKKNAAMGDLKIPQKQVSTAMPVQMPSMDIPSNAEYLKNYSLSELFSYLCIGVVTLNKPILNLCIKLFPYVPMPIIKSLVYKVYCGGETMQDLHRTGERLSARGINNMMLSLTIEACDGNDNVDPEYIVSETKRSITEFMVPYTVKTIETSGKDINSIPPAYVALKPTGFAQNAAQILKDFKTDPVAAEQFEQLVEKVSAIVQVIYDSNMELSKKYPQRVAPIVVAVIDAEKHELQEGVYELQRRVYKQFNKLDQPISVVGTLQMYLSGSAQLLALEEQLARENNYRLGLKLVRGAYIHSEKERAAIIHKTKENTDVNYNHGITYCIENILANKEQGNDSTIGHLVVASHNAESLTLATEKLNVAPEDNFNKNNVVLGQLLGMADNITYNLIKNKNVDNVIKYVPWGPPLETKAYLLRRLEENGDAVKNDNGFNLIKAVFTVFFKRVFRLA